MFDHEAFGAAMGDMIREAVEPLHKEISALKAKLAEKPDFSESIADEVAKAVSALPKPEPGKSITVEDVMPVIDEAMKGIRNESNLAVERILNDGRADRDSLQKAIKEIRQPQDGKSVTVDDVRPMLDAALVQLRKDADDAIAQPLQLVDAARDLLLEKIAELKQPEDGKSVTVAELEPIIQAEVDKAVRALPVPKDGAGVAGAMIDREGELLLTLSNGEVKKLGRIVGKDGVDLTDVSFEYDGERSLTIIGKGGSITKRLPIPMDRGYFRDGMPALEKGDIVTHDGNAWIALKETKARPSTDAKEDWRLFARKGRDGESVSRKATTEPARPIKLKD